MRWIYSLLIPFLLLSATIQSQIDTASLSSIVDKHFSQSPVKGLAVSIVDRNGVLLSKTEGKNIDSALDEKTPLWLGSVSKTMTALGVCRLVHLDKIGLTAPINTYLPASQHVQNGDVITVKDLLHHHSGIAQEAGYARAVEYDGQLNTIVPISRPGEKGIYSSANFTILGLIIEHVTGQPYAKFMLDEVFTPLGMKNTVVPSTSEGKNEKGYCLAYGLPLTTHQMDYGYYVVPAGYLLTTLEDLNVYSRFLLGNGTLVTTDTTQRFLQEELFISLFTPYQDGTFGYGKAWGIGQTAGLKTYSHEGMTKISNAQITILPEQGLVVNVISNTNSGPFFSIASELSESIVSSIGRKEAEGILFWEYTVRICIGLLTLKMIFDVVRSARRWIDNGYATTIEFQFSKLHVYVFELMPLLVLIFLPKLINTPISMLLRIMPDIGWSILLGAILSILTCLFKLVDKQAVKVSG